MIPRLHRIICDIARPNNPDSAQLLVLTSGWSRYFDARGIVGDAQIAEFEAVMRERLFAGEDSIVAPEIDA